MHLAVNYSHEAARLLEAGAVQLDYFKCPDWPDLVEEASQLLPVAVHFALRAGSGSLENKKWGKVEALLKLTGTPYVNLHLQARRSDFPDVTPDFQTPIETERILSTLIKDVSAAVRRFGADRIIVENVPYHGAAGKALRACVMPETIKTIVEQTGCGLLLDISHARISAQALGMDSHEYIGQLPCKRLREVHFTGLEWMDGHLQDHLPIREEDWPELEWALRSLKDRSWAPAWLLALEYGGVGADFAWRSDAAVMAVQIPHIRHLMQTI